MNKLYKQSTVLHVPVITQDALDAPWDMFSDQSVGNCFLVATKKVNSLYMKIDRKHAVLLINSRGAKGKIDRMDAAERIYPLDCEMQLEFSELTSAGHEFSHTLQREAEKLRALRPLQQVISPDQQVRDAQAVIDRLGAGESFAKSDRVHSYD